jgi:hypothetical protein
MLTNGALGDADTMPCIQDGANLGCRPAGQLDAQGAGFVEQLGVATDGAQVRAWVGLEAIQTVLAVRADPAIECAA